ncbi:MAG: alpha/beta hydrolase [Arenimonas sp.]
MTSLRLTAALAGVLALAACATTAPQAANAPAPERAHTAGANVHVLAPMHIAGLDRDRIVRIYLPPGYNASTDRYPVLYLQDGQNLFDDATSYVGEWGVDESLDALARDGLPFIAVGIDHGGEKRINELAPWLLPKLGTAEGDAYLAFVTDTVKPYVDAHYRTKSDRDHTLIGGSSMGGVMAHYAIEQHPELFGKALVFSPAFWTGGDAPLEFTRGRTLSPGTRYYAVTGGKEGDEALGDLRGMTDVLRANASPGVVLFSEVREGAEHNETFWKSEFPRAVRWLFAEDGAARSGDTEK